MRVLILNYEYPPLGGGAARATAEILRQFGNTPGLQMELVTSSTGPAGIEDPFPNIRIHRLDIGKDGNPHYQSVPELLRYTRRAIRYSRRLHRERPFDLVHAFFGIPCGYIARRLGIPYIVSLRGSDVPGYSDRFRTADRLLFRRMSRRIWADADSVVPNSQGLKRLAKETAPDQRMLVIPNGVDTGFFAPLAKKEDSPVVRLVSTGRLIGRKGYGILIRALDGMDHVSLTLAGDGPLRESLEQEAAERKVDCRFAGILDPEGVRDLLAGSDVFVLPSLNEGMSNSLLEAMACGLPVITTDTGGSEELVDGNGMTVRCGDPASLRRAIYALAGDASLREEMGQRSRARATARNWHTVAERYHDLYREVVQRHSGG